MGVGCSSSQPKNKILVINGVTAVGKSTLYKKMLEMEEFQGKFTFCISHTTRQPRSHEVDGVDYKFVDVQTFEDMINHNKFIEYTKNHNNYYGTSFTQLDLALQESNVILDIDYKGSVNLKKVNLGNKQLYVLITPPDNNSFIQRLRDRGTETEEQIQTRIKTAQEELKFFEKSGNFYHCRVCNDEIDRAVKELAQKVSKFIK